MNSSQSLTSLAPALVKAQKSMQAAVKDSNNPFFKSKYADLNSVMDAVKGPLHDNGLCFIQACHEHDKAIGVETIIIHESGEWLSGGEVVLPALKEDPQGYASSMTYCRRYSLSSVTGIGAEDDDGNAASQPQQQRQWGNDTRPQATRNTKERYSAPASAPPQTDSFSEPDPFADEVPDGAKQQQSAATAPLACTGCGKTLTKSQYDFSLTKFGTPLCPDCQRASKK